jgi:ribonuclease Z
LILTNGHEHLLFDAGRGVSTQLARAGIAPEQVNPIFITHHHFDHIGNLADLLLSSWNNGRTEPLQVIGPPGTAAIVSALFDHVYGRDIMFRLAEAARSEAGLADIRTLVHVSEVEPGLVYDRAGWRVLAEFVEHGHGLGLSVEVWPCLGYRVETPAGIVAISGDTVPCAGLDRLARGADVLVQCCYLAEAEITSRDAALVPQYILASSGQVGKIAARAGVRKLVLTHFRQKSEALLHSIAADVRQDFAGDLFLGEDLMEIEL